MNVWSRPSGSHTPEPWEDTPAIIARFTARYGAERVALIRHWHAHPWNWLRGKDEFGNPLIRTTDEKDPNEPVKAFPATVYLKRYIEILHRRPTPVLLVDKSRQMLITTSTLLFMDWQCRFRIARRWLLSKRTEDEAEELLETKTRTVHRRLPDWVADAFPLKPRPAKRALYPATGSYTLATAQNVASSTARGGTASGIFIDEAARQAEFQAILSASGPMAYQLVAVTTADVGTPGSMAFEKAIKEGGLWKGCRMLQRLNQEREAEADDDDRGTAEGQAVEDSELVSGREDEPQD